jgi:hypothetical protein
MGPLAMDRQIAPMAQPSIGTQIHVSLDVLRDLAPQITFDFVHLIDNLSQAHHLVIAQVVALLVAIDVRLVEYVVR